MSLDNIGPEVLQATVNSATFFHCTRAYSHAYVLYKQLHTVLSNSLPPNNILCIGTLINCARSAHRSNELEYAVEKLRSTVAWCEDHPQKPDEDSFYLCIKHVLIALTKKPTVISSSTLDLREDMTNTVEILYDTLQRQTFLAQCLFAPISAIHFQQVACPCLKLFKLTTCLVRAGLELVSGHAGSFEIDNGDELNAEDEIKWNTTRNLLIFLHINQPALQRNVRTAFSKFPVTCNCRRCGISRDSTNIEMLTGVTMLAALSILIYEQTAPYMGGPAYQHLNKCATLGLAADLCMRRSFLDDNSEGVQNSIKIIEDFFALHRACCEAWFVINCNKDIPASSRLIRKVQETFYTPSNASQLKHHDEINGFLKPGTSDYTAEAEFVKTSLENVYLESIQEEENVGCVSARTDRHDFQQTMSSLTKERLLDVLTENLALLETESVNTRGVKRTRSIASPGTYNVASPCGSFRSFEGFARRLNQRSNGSLRSTISEISRMSSHRSWNFDIVSELVSAASSDDPESFSRRVNKLTEARVTSPKATISENPYTESDSPSQGCGEASDISLIMISALDEIRNSGKGNRLHRQGSQSLR